MKIYLIFYTDIKYRLREQYFKNKAENIGFYNVINYRREWLETTDFYLENKYILDMPRGNGYWLWKPYIILETFKQINDKDVVFYVDAGDDITDNNIKNVIRDYMINNNYIISNSLSRPSNKIYIKRDCFILMDCDKEIYHDGLQIEAGTLVFKKTLNNEYLLNEWLFYCKNKNIITDIDNVYGKNFNEFIEHRHDQSILTNLTIKHNMKYTDILFAYIKYNTFIPS